MTGFGVCDRVAKEPQIPFGNDNKKTKATAKSYYGGGYCGGWRREAGTKVELSILGSAVR